jgi:hypothetical protein
MNAFTTVKVNQSGWKTFLKTFTNICRAQRQSPDWRNALESLGMTLFDIARAHVGDYVTFRLRRIQQAGQPDTLQLDQVYPDTWSNQTVPHQNWNLAGLPQDLGFLCPLIDQIDHMNPVYHSYFLTAQIGLRGGWQNDNYDKTTDISYFIDTRLGGDQRTQFRNLVTTWIGNFRTQLKNDPAVPSPVFLWNGPTRSTG